MAESDLKFRKAGQPRIKGGEVKPYKLADRDGLYLYVSATGAKSWRFDFRFQGRRQTLTFGEYPEIPLAGERGARGLLAKARAALAHGENPAMLKQRDRQDAMMGDTFKALAEEWHKAKVQPRSEGWQKRARYSLGLVYGATPDISPRKLTEIRAADVLAVLKYIEAQQTPYMAEYTRRVVSLVFSYAIHTLRAEVNPAKGLARIIEVPKPKSYAHVSLNELPAFLKAVDDDAECLPETKLATRLLVLLFVRKSELIQAKWEEFDLDRGIWEIPGERMKNGMPHIVPLPAQAIVLLTDLKALARGSEYVIRHRDSKDRPMAESRLNHFISRLGYHKRLTPHGLRHIASTALNEAGFRGEVIERQLSHIERDNVRRAYNKADYLSERRELMTYWAGLVDSLCAGSKVVLLRAKAA